MRGWAAACPFTANREAARDKARSAATNRPARPAQRGRTGRQQGPEWTPGAEEAGGRQRKAAQRASERRRPQTHTREPGQKPPNSYRKPRPRRTGGTGATGAGSAQGAHKRPKDQIRARAAKRPGRGATRTRTGRQPAHGGAAPGAEAHNQADPTNQSRAARPIGARGKARAQEPRARARRQNTKTADQQAKEPVRPRRASVWPRGERPSREQPSAARRREGRTAVCPGSCRRLRSVQPETVRGPLDGRAERSGAALAVGYYSLPFWRALRSILTAWVW